MCIYPLFITSYDVFDEIWSFFVESFVSYLALSDASRFLFVEKSAASRGRTFFSPITRRAGSFVLLSLKCPRITESNDISLADLPRLFSAQDGCSFEWAPLWNVQNRIMNIEKWCWKWWCWALRGIDGRRVKTESKELWV